MTKSIPAINSRLEFVSDLDNSGMKLNLVGSRVERVSICKGWIRVPFASNLERMDHVEET